jgi:hypothetical protein
VKRGVMLLAVVALLSLFGSAGGASTASAIPIGASTTTPAGSSVVFAMGHLHDPSNTFWELFLRPAGSVSWALHTPPGVATNGGLVLSAAPSGPLGVGFLVSADLKFSPVAQSVDGGVHWSPGELPAALTSAPDALAVGPGEALAIVAGQRVLQASGDLSAWKTLTSENALRRAAPACGVVGVTAVAYAAHPLVGVSCAHAGGVGILAQSASWHDIGPSLSGTASVLRLVNTTSGVSGLAQVRSGQRLSLAGFWGDGSSSQWSGPTSFAVPSGWSIEATATGGGAGQGLAVLLGSGERRRVEVVSGPDAPWTTLPPAPRGAIGVSAVGTEIDTFVVSGSHLAVWTWTPGTTTWSRTASITVPVPYGSSS